MNTKEVHSFLEDMQREYTRHREAYSEELIEANGEAILALEKQIPKKPIFVDTWFRHLGKHISDGTIIDKCYKCPNPDCNYHIFHTFDSERYCVHCGQALDWE